MYVHYFIASYVVALMMDEREYCVRMCNFRGRFVSVDRIK